MDDCVKTEGPNDITVSAAGGSSGQDGLGSGSACIEVEVEYESILPTVSILVDRSGSMGFNPDFAISIERLIANSSFEAWGCSPGEGRDETLPAGHHYKWNIVRQILFNPTDGIVPRYQHSVRFGMDLYTDVPTAGGTCPLLIHRDFGIENADELLNAMQCDDVGQSTPTREALTAAAAGLHAVEEPGDKVIILATDGAPTTCDCPRFEDDAQDDAPEHCLADNPVERDGQMLSPQQAAQYDLVEEARRIHEQWGIAISVIGMITEEEVQLHEHLGALAEAGGGTLYDGLEPEGLANAFVTSVEEARSCSVDLLGEISPGAESAGTLTLEGEVLEEAEVGGDGYRVLSPSQIELLGAPCELLKSGGHRLDISFPCDTFIVIR